MPLKKITLFLICLLLAACGGDGGDGGGGQTSSVSKLLLWVGDGPAPDQRVGSSAGQIAYLRSDGTFDLLMELDAGVIGVSPCGNEALSPDGSKFSFFVNAPQSGADAGTLYQISGGGTPIMVTDTLPALSCVGNGTFQYSPDSKRFAYIVYDELGSGDEFVTGTLEIRDAETIGSIANTENVAGFYLTNDAAYSVRFFPNNNGQVDEAALSVWNGTESNEAVAFYAEGGCRFTNVQLAPTNNNQLAAMFGQRCGSSMSWQFHLINLADNTSTMALNDSMSTSFFPYTRTNTMIPAAGGGTMLFTLPDGLTASTVGIQRVDVSTLIPETVVERGAVMPRYDARSFSLPSNASAVSSRDGRWLAVVIAETPARIVVIDTTNPAAAPKEVTAPTRSDNVPFMVFSDDGSNLYYLMGGTNGTENTLFKLDLASASSIQVSRGQYSAGAVSPDGNSIALGQWLRAEDTRQTPYTNLVAVNTTDGTTTTLFTGVELEEDGDVANRRFAHPLTWFR